MMSWIRPSSHPAISPSKPPALHPALHHGPGLSERFHEGEAERSAPMAGRPMPDPPMLRQLRVLSATRSVFFRFRQNLRLPWVRPRKAGSPAHPRTLSTTSLNPASPRSQLASFPSPRPPCPQSRALFREVPHERARGRAPDEDRGHLCRRRVNATTCIHTAIQDPSC